VRFFEQEAQEKQAQLDKAKKDHTQTSRRAHEERGDERERERKAQASAVKEALGARDSAAKEAKRLKNKNEKYKEQVLQTHGKYTRAKQELQRQRAEAQALRDANELQVQHALSRVHELEKEREVLLRGRERELFSASSEGAGDFGVKGLRQQGELQERELTKYLSNLENLGKEANASS
jgi:hypothetical protein